MSGIEAYAEGFKVNYEKFLVGCDALEEENAWDIEQNGDMDVYFANDLICTVIRLIAADGRFAKNEVNYLNKMLDFEYEVEELEDVYRECGERIDTLFETELPESISRLEELNPSLAETYKQMLLSLCLVISESDGEIALAEKRDAELLKSLCE